MKVGQERQRDRKEQYETDGDKLRDHGDKDGIRYVERMEVPTNGRIGHISAQQRAKVVRSTMGASGILRVTYL